MLIIHRVVLDADGIRMAVASVDGEEQEFAVRFVDGDSGSARLVHYLEHEYALKDKLGADWAMVPRGMVRESSRILLRYEDAEWTPLSLCIEQMQTMAQVLDTASALVSSLSGLHQKRLIHQAVRPEHVMLHQQTGRVRLSGFGKTGPQCWGNQSGDLTTFPHAFPYLSPEQTGRMNRIVDERSDLYACGVVLFQLFTKNFPFDAADPVEWIRCHVAHGARDPRDFAPGLPEVLCGMLRKLLAKAAEDRYQTSNGLLSDINRCRDELRSTGAISAFPLASRDVPSRLAPSQKLFGRDEEMNLLRALYAGVASGTGLALVTLTGHAGIGKSALVYELNKYVVRDQGFFGVSKCDQYRRNVPFGAFIHAIRALIAQLLKEHAAEVARWQDLFAQVVGDAAAQLAGLIPELRRFVPYTVAGAPQTPAEESNRLRQSLLLLLHSLSFSKRPIVLFLDDVQWADSASLEFLRFLAMSDVHSNCLLIVSFRENELAERHELQRVLHALRASNRSVTELTLRPLRAEHVVELVCASLRMPAAEVTALANLVFEKTAGNPFFAAQFLGFLLQEHLLWFDPELHGWRWNLQAIASCDVTDNVVDLLVEKLRRFSAPTQHLLLAAACLGGQC